RAIGDQGSAFGKNLTFTVPNQVPEAQVDEPYFAVGAPLTIDALRNDRDADGDKLTITSKTTVSPSTAGTVALVKNKLVFTPSSSFTTGIATFDYTIRDGFGGTDTATVRLTALPITLTPASITRPAAGGSYNLSITAFATQVTENLPWLSAVETGSGVHTSTVQITLLPNTGSKARSGRIIIDGQTHDVVQSGVTKPSITPMSSTPHEAIVSGFFSLAIPLVDGPATFTATDLPPGLKIDNVTNLITGTPTTAGTYNVVIKAKNAAGPLATDTAGTAAATATCTIHVSDLDLNLIGSYQGLVSRNAVAFISSTGNLGTRLQLTTTKSGGVTGQLLEGTTKLSLKGQLTADVMDPTHPRLIINTTAATTKLPVTLDVTFDAANNSLAGDFRINGNLRATAAVQGWRNIWKATNPATSYAADYSATLHYAGPPSSLIPSADANASFTIAPTTGNLTIISTLADGSKVTCATFVGPAGQVLFYQALYNNRGSITGRLDLTLGSPAPSNNTLLGTLTWLRPAALPASKDPLYRAGFGPIELDVTGDTP
ncbi:MAG: Ig-like domain-containing protein, partial [Verrucomicrobia bacterium]|nr:Ig-like domain-containing protein [Verrucomicrobiota bacterium]